MSDILEQMTAAQTNHDAMRWGWIAEWADEIKRLRARVLDLENSLRLSRAEATAQADGALSLLAAGYAESEENKKLRSRVAEFEAAQEWRLIGDLTKEHGNVLVSRNPLAPAPGGPAMSKRTVGVGMAMMYDRFIPPEAVECLGKTIDRAIRNAQAKAWDECCKAWVAGGIPNPTSKDFMDRATNENPYRWRAKR